MSAEKDEDYKYDESFWALVRQSTIWDRLMVLIAALLTFCAFAFLFKPAMGPAITKVFEDITASQEAEKVRLEVEAVKARAESGEVEVMLFPSQPKTPE